MSCRTTPAGSAITSFSRISEGPGEPLSDVATLSLFHDLRRDFASRRHNAFWMGENADDVRRFMWLMPDPGLRGDSYDETYRNILARYRENIENDGSITEARRASLLARLQAAESAETPDPATLYALANMQNQANERRQAQHRFLTQVASELGQDYSDVRARFRELENSIDRSRSAQDPETYTEENRRLAESLGMSTEPGAVHAFISLRAEGQAAYQGSLNERPDIISQYSSVPASARRAVPESNLEVVEYGYDITTNYISFKVKNTETGEIETHGYRAQMRAEEIDRGMRGEYMRWSWNSGTSREETMDAGVFYHEFFANRAYNRFRDDTEALEASRAPRCARCGQWANNVHSCPAPFTDAPTYTLNNRMLIGSGVRTSRQVVDYEYERNGQAQAGEFEVDLPLVAEYRRLFKENGSLLIRNVRGYGNWSDREEGSYGNANVTGDIFIKRNEDGTVEADTRSLKCTCLEYRANDYQCRHTRAMGAAAIKRSIPPQRAASSMTAEERAERAAARQARYDAINATNWAENEAYAEEMRKSWKPNSEISYSEDFDSFYTLYNTLNEEKAAKGSLKLPYKKENALNGLATRASGQAFGVEIEYDFPADMDYQQRREAQEKIGKALKEANLTPTDQQQRYHSAASNGYTDKHVDADGKGTWSWETDATVAGELVTPMMYDEPETWEKLEKAVSILRENGAVPTTRAGAHVHVGTSKFGKDPNKYAELVRMAGQHEDVLYRISADPSRGEHRGKDTRFTYVSPVGRVPVQGFQDASDLRRYSPRRSSIVNLSGVKVDDDFKKSHVEFRMFDSTLDAGTMQQQIKLAVSMTEAANRVSHKGGSKRVKESVGDHAERLKQRGRRKPKKEDIASETATFRSLLDTLYQSKEDKDSLVKLFVANTWLKLTPGVRRSFQLEPQAAA